jgi:hypothetical protein
MFVLAEAKNEDYRQHNFSRRATFSFIGLLFMCKDSFPTRERSLESRETRDCMLMMGGVQ